MSRAIFLNQLRGLRWQVVWYGLGLAFYAAFMVWLFPFFKEAIGDFEYPAEFLAFFGGTGDLADPRVFVQVEYFSFAPIILVIYGVMAGTGMLAGDEGRRTLEPVLAQPVSRSTVFVSRAAALMCALLLIVAVNALGWITSVPFVDLGDMTLLVALGATLAAVPLVAVFAALGLLLAAVAPTRGSAAGVMAVGAILAYLVSSLAQAIEPIAWMRWLSPYYYSDSHQVLTFGVVWWHQGVLVGLAVVAGTLAWLAFRGREIDAGVWQPGAIMRGWADLAR
jgi:ABC-2 type transport system permease protein